MVLARVKRHLAKNNEARCNAHRDCYWMPRITVHLTRPPQKFQALFCPKSLRRPTSVPLIRYLCKILFQAKTDVASSHFSVAQSLPRWLRVFYDVRCTMRMPERQGKGKHTLSLRRCVRERLLWPAMLFQAASGDGLWTVLYRSIQCPLFVCHVESQRTRDGFTFNEEIAALSEGQPPQR